MKNNKLTTIAILGRALSDPGRLRALLALRQGELCLSQILALLKLAPSTVSKHLSVLKQAGLVESRKAGKWIYYRLADRPAASVAKILAWLKIACTGDALSAKDQMQLKKIRCCDLKTLCRLYKIPTKKRDNKE